MEVKTRVNLAKRKNKGISLFLICIGTFSPLSDYFGVMYISAQTASSFTETVTIDAVVISNTVSPATPPPSPSVITNNGVPLVNESGTDSAIFKGKAYSGSTVSVLKNGLVLNELPANIDGTFEVPVHNIRPGTYTFSLLAKDSKGLKSSTVTYTIVITSGSITEVSDIVIPPTITTDKIEVKAGDLITFSGTSVPNSDILLSLFIKSGINKTVSSNSKGEWSYILSTKDFELGDYNAKARTKISTDVSSYSETVLFTIGTSNKMRKSGLSSSTMRCDLNNDSRVNLLDFSIMAFWYKRLGFPIKVDLNSDKRINLTDLSILAYCWTG